MSGSPARAQQTIREALGQGSRSSAIHIEEDNLGALDTLGSAETAGGSCEE